MGRQYDIACEQGHLGQFSAGAMEISTSGNKPVTVMSLWDRGAMRLEAMSFIFFIYSSSLDLVVPPHV